MLWDASSMNGYAIEATDGRIGTVSDMLFDDVGWAVRWLVVDTGVWLPGRKVLLPLSVLGHPDKALRTFPVTLTQKQVEDSPNIDADQPVSRQTEGHLYRHYRHEPYWGGGIFPVSDEMATPMVTPLGFPDMGARVCEDLYVPSNPGDPHLRSIYAVTGYHIAATDGDIGHAEAFLVDDARWTIRYIVVDTQNWWAGEKVLISPPMVERIDWPEKRVHVKADRQKIKDGPRYDPMITVDGAYDESFLTYYGIRWTKA